MQQNEKRQPTSEPSSRAGDQTGQDQEFQDLELAFLGSLVPGIVHNLATPLSGVLGATQLLEKRTETISDMLTDGQDFGETERSELLKQLDRNRANVDILARNARHLADILRGLVQRINRGSSGVREYYPLNELLQDELRFLDANLAFKHKVRKQVTLGAEVRTIKYVYGHVAAAVDEFVTASMAAHDFRQNGMEMDFRTEPGETHVELRIEARSSHLTARADEESTLCRCLDLLRDEGWTVEMEYREGLRRMRLLCPRQTAPA
jgi:signal transduction histidine kinase